MTQRGRTIETADDRVMLIAVPTGDTGSAWHVFIVRGEGSTLSLIAERSATAGDGSVAGWARSHRPARALVVLPASATVCRTCPLPPTQGEQLASALRLQAETALLGGVPWHRVATAALPSQSATPTGRQGVILAWPETADIPEPPTLPDSCEIRYVPIVASLLALFRGEAPASPLVAATREDGSIVLIFQGTADLVIRSAREDGSDASAWREGVQRVTAETLLNADRSADDVRALHAQLATQQASSPDGSFVLLPSNIADAISRQLPGGRTGNAEKDRARMIALGTSLVVSGPLSGLAAIREAIPSAPPSKFEAVTAWLASPRNTMLAVFIATLVFLLGPLGFSALRYGILRMKVSEPEKLEALNRQTEQSVLVYKQLSTEAWPMTKLLGDLSNSLPEGIEIETLQLGYGEGLMLRGYAKPFEQKGATGTPVKRTATEELIRLESLLRSTQIFTNTQSKWEDERANGYRGFQLNCSVVTPTKIVQWAKDEDYALNSLRDRRYPNWRDVEKGSAPAPHVDEPAATASAEKEPERVATKPATESSETETETKPDDRTMASGDDASTPGHPEGAGEIPPAAAPARGIGRAPRPNPDQPAGNGENPRPSQPASTPAVEIPPPVADEELNAMSKSDAQALLGKLSKARQLPNLDEPTKTRLREDFNRVLSYVKSK
ncbi:MAG: hypothetical protein JNM94_13710 [Phycisphaerae bacterium]|nr:hypothetical protein [Phycisphaerae bacterium]